MDGLTDMQMERETFISDDDLVLKTIHEDGSETSVKTVSSCDTIRNPVTGELEFNNVERNKYSVFASSSRGCFMNCNFCYLTIKGCDYAKLEEAQILQNLKDAVIEQMEHKPETKDRYVKLCWMGMGEDQIAQPERTYNITKNFLEWILENQYAIGVDGVDLATVMPKVKPDWMHWFDKINDLVGIMPLNPNNKIRVHGQGMPADAAYINRSPFRVFYSLHSGIQETRDKIIPNALPLEQAISKLKGYTVNNLRNVIFHHMFMEGQNDSEAEVDALLALIDRHGLQQHEFRILRYNHCNDADFGESERFSGIIDRLVGHIPFLKVQISTGTEVRAACGQFIVKQYENK